MGTGQMLITVGALILLGLVVLRVNNGFLNTGTVIMETKFNLLAISLATSIIEEATGKAFDNNTDTSSVDVESALSTCGPESGEIYPNFNDFDDFDGLNIINDEMPSADYRIQCNVGYVDESDPNKIITNKKTWHKRIEVLVTSESMTDSVRLSTIYSYFYFR